MGEGLLFAFSIVDTGAVLFLLVYFVITLSDLECDYLNAQQCCSKLNMHTTENTTVLNDDSESTEPPRVLIFVMMVQTCPRSLPKHFLELSWVIPKLVANVIILVLFIFYGFWFLALGNLPIVLWMTYEYVTIPSGNTGVYDPTEIHNRGQLKKHMRDCMIYLGWYLISFFIYLYCMIISLLRDNPLEKDTSHLNVNEF